MIFFLTIIASYLTEVLLFIFLDCSQSSVISNYSSTADIVIFYQQSCHNLPDNKHLYARPWLGLFLVNSDPDPIDLIDHLYQPKNFGKIYASLHLWLILWSQTVVRPRDSKHRSQTSLKESWKVLLVTLLMTILMTLF